MGRLRFNDVQAILVSKGYEAEKVPGGYKCLGHRFRNLTELKFWAEGLPITEKEARIQEAIAAFDEVEEPYHDDSQKQCELTCDVYQGGKDAHDVMCERWVQVGYELGQMELYGESPNWQSMTMGERCEYQERRLVQAQKCNNPLPKTEFEIYQEAATKAVLQVGSGLDAESVEARGAIIADDLAQDFCWEEVRKVIQNTVKAIVKRTDFMNIWTLIPERWRTLARGFLKRHYLSKIQASCRSFAEMVKVSRMVDKLA